MKHAKQPQMSKEKKVFISIYDDCFIEKEIEMDRDIVC